jgi:cellulose synthase/poly-beta-1,6-N-acetylglucosamine synthase-like glycosyltransferase
MVVIGLLIASFAFALLAVFPYVIYPWTLRLLHEQPLTLDPDARTPSATLVFCAYNEQASIPAKLDNLRAIRGVLPAIRFHCYVDKSSDDTLALLSAHPDLVTVHTAPERTGKAAGMAQMMARCDTDVVIFTDANVMLDPASVPRLLAYFSDPMVGGVCGTLHYTNPGDSSATITSSAYWRLEERIKRRESLSGSTMGADGSIFATRRALYPQVPVHLLDDMLVSMNVIFMGHRLISASDVLAYETAVTGSAAEFRRRRRIACRAYLTHAYMRRHLQAMPGIDRYKYTGHKLLRWYSVWLGLISAELALMSLAVAVGPVLWPLVTAALLVVLVAGARPLQLVIEAAGQFLATGLGMIDVWLGRRYQTWDTPANRALVSLATAPADEDAARVPA